MMRTKLLILLLSFGFAINSVALSSDLSEEDLREPDLIPTLKRIEPEAPSKTGEEPELKRARMEEAEFPILEKALFQQALSRLLPFDNPHKADEIKQRLAAEAESQQEFKQIPREAQNGICLLTGQGDTNKKILNFLSPKDVKSVMWTCRCGYWLGRTRGIIRLADPDKVKQRMNSFHNFMGAMVSDPAFPVKTLDLTQLQRPGVVFEQLLLRKKLRSLTDNLLSYEWKNNTLRNTHYVTYMALDPIPAQIEMLKACSNLKCLVVTSLDAFKPSLDDEAAPEELGLVAEREYPRITSLTAALKKLEVFRCGPDWRMPKTHLSAVLRGFRSLRVLDYLSASMFSKGENPFRILAVEDDPQSGLLLFPSLQEIVIDGMDSYKFDIESLASSFQPCTNLRRLDFRGFFDSADTLSAAHQAFLNIPTLEIVNIALRKGKQTFTLSRTRPDETLQLSSSKSLLFPSPSYLLEFFATLREEFPLEQYPGVVLKEMTLPSYSADHPDIPCSRDELIGLGDTISQVQVLHLPGLGDYPMKTLVAFLEKLPHLVELDLSDSYKRMPDSAYIYAAARVKHLDISGRDKIHPELIEKILKLGTLKTLALSYIKERKDRKIRSLIDKTMVDGWRAEFPNTKILVPQERTIMTDKRPRKAKVK